MSENSTQYARSAFVTVVAWVFIAIFGLVAALMALASAMSLALPSSEALGKATLSFMVAAPLAVVAVSIGLLMRRNWARIAFVLVLVALMAWSLMTAVGVFMLSRDWEGSMTVFVDLTACLSLVFTALFAYLAWLLSTRAIASEFRR